MTARRMGVIPPVLLGSAVLLFANSGPSLYRIQLVTLAGIWAVAAIGLGLLLGGAGQISLGHAGFVGAGAWAVAVFTREQEWPFLLAAILAVVIATVIGFVLGYATLRLEGHYLALATLAFGLLFFEVMDTFLVAGIYGVPALELFGWEARSARSLLLVVWVVVLLVYVAARSLVRSRFGRSVAALRDDPMAASSCGIDLSRTKISVFAIAAAVGGLSGALFAPYQTSVTDSSFGFFLSINLLMMVVVGGLRSPMGAIIGSLFLVIIPELGRSWEEYRLFAYGIVLVAVIVLLPDGFAGIGKSLLRWFRRFSGDGEPVSVDSAVTAVDEVHSARTPVSALIEDGDPLLRARGISRRFGGIVAVQSVDFDLAQRQIHALIGPNGAGKTTFFNCISGVDKPDEGSVLLGEIQLAGTPAHVVAGNGLMRTFQHARPFRGLTLQENVMVGAHSRSRAGVFTGTARTRRARLEERSLAATASELLDLVGLGGLSKRLAGDLTLVDERRLELARCLAGDPKVLLLDEPAAGLGDREADDLAVLIDRLRTERGVAVILIEHHLEMALGVADQVTVLDFGVVIARGSPAEVRTDARVIEAYIGSSV